MQRLEFKDAPARIEANSAEKITIKLSPKIAVIPAVFA